MDLNDFNLWSQTFYHLVAMDLNDFKLWSQTFYHLVASFSFIVAAIWFIITTKAKKRIQLDVDAIIFDTSYEYFICEAHIILENKGFVPHKIYDMAISVRGLRDNMEKPVIKTKNGSIILGEKIVGARSIIYEKNDEKKLIKNNYYFVRPGVKQVIKYNLLIPKKYSSISILAGFTYKQRKVNKKDIKKICAEKKYDSPASIEKIKDEIQKKGALFKPFEKHNHPHRASKLVPINKKLTR